MQVFKALKGLLDIIELAQMGGGWVIAGIVMAILGIAAGAANNENTIDNS